MGHARRLIKKILFISIVLLIVAYVYYQSINLATGPEITITSPIDGSTVTESLVVFSGTTENISHITFNDRPIFINEKGEFSQALLVLPGLNIIEVDAGDRFGRTTKKILQIVYRKKDKVKEVTSEKSDINMDTKLDEASSTDSTGI